MQSNQDYVLQNFWLSQEFAQELMSWFEIKDTEDGKITEICKNTIICENP